MVAMVKEAHKSMNPEEHLPVASGAEVANECSVHGIVILNRSLNWP